MEGCVSGTVSGNALVAAVLVAFMEKQGLVVWSGTEEKLYANLTKFKNDEANTPAILRAMLKLEKARKAVIDP
jgi:hypothetical protein